MARTYASIMAGITGVLGEVVDALEPSGHRYIVIGGWPPYLLCSSPIPHPGTRDVDLLFEQGATENALEEIVALLLEVGYIPSAKHEFQLIRLLDIGGREIAFNVDLLHPGEGPTAPNADLFVKHFDYAVPRSSSSDVSYLARSLVTPDAQLLFDHSLHSDYVMAVDLPSGDTTTVAVPLMDEIGLLATKAQSIRKPKRDRDAFDVALAVCQPRELSDLRIGAQGLGVAEDGRHRLAGIVDELREPKAGKEFRDRVALYLPGADREAVAARLTLQVEEFLKSIGAAD